MTVKNIKEWEARVRAAMEPKTGPGGGFTPGIQKLRKSARGLITAS